METERSDSSKRIYNDPYTSSCPPCKKRVIGNLTKALRQAAPNLLQSYAGITTIANYLVYGSEDDKTAIADRLKDYYSDKSDQLSDDLLYIFLNAPIVTSDSEDKSSAPPVTSRKLTLPYEYNLLLTNLLELSSKHEKNILDQTIFSLVRDIKNYIVFKSPKPDNTGKIITCLTDTFYFLRDNNIVSSISLDKMIELLKNLSELDLFLKRNYNNLTVIPILEVIFAPITDQNKLHIILKAAPNNILIGLWHNAFKENNTAKSRIKAAIRSVKGIEICVDLREPSDLTPSDRIIRTSQLAPYASRLEIAGFSTTESVRSLMESVANLPEITALIFHSNYPITGPAYNSIPAESASYIAAAVRDNKYLTELDLWTTKLTNAAATEIIKELNQNTTLTRLSLRGMTLNDEGVSSLASALTSNTTLKSLDIAVTGITSSNSNQIAEALLTNSTLENLILAANKLNPTTIKKIALALTGKSQLQTLDFSGYQLIGAEQYIPDALRTNTSLRKLIISCGNNTINISMLSTSISNALKVNSTLQDLILNDMQLTPSNALSLANALKTNNGITSLNLSQCHIGPIGSALIFQALKQNTTLTRLNLGAIDMTTYNFTNFTEGLGSNPALTYLNLSEAKISGYQVRHLAKALEENSTLLTLILCHIKIENRGAQDIAQAISVNTTLTDLNLDSTDIESEGAKHIAKALMVNTSLKNLNLKWNSQIGPVGALHLTNALMANATLMTLDISRTNLGDSGAKFILDALLQNSTLQELDMSGNNISDDGMLSIARALRENGSLKILNLGFNEIPHIGAKYIAEALKVNTSLKSLDISGNKMGPDGAKHIAQALKGNSSLTWLSMRRTKIDLEGAKHIAQALILNSSLTFLDYRDESDDIKRILRQARDERNNLPDTQLLKLLV